MNASYRDVITKHLTGDLFGIEIVADGNGAPQKLIVSDSVFGREVDPLMIECLADILCKMRKEAGDERSLCGYHGYLNDKFEDCIGCRDKREADKGNELCVTCSQEWKYRVYHKPSKHLAPYTKE